MEYIKTKLPNINSVLNPIFSIISLNYDVHKVMTDRGTTFGRAIIGTKTINGIDGAIIFISDKAISYLQEKDTTYILTHDQLDVG